jgi:cytochrome c oxidase cbb3-type subunit 3
MSKLVVGHIIGIVLLAVAQLAIAAPDGTQLYDRHCAVCHNSNGMGGIGLPLNGAKINQFPRKYLFKTIRHGRPGRVMPAFARLSDAQVNAIVDHVLGWSDSPTPLTFSQQLIVGDTERGKALFETHCADCHGADGKSGGTGTGVTLSRERKFDVIPPALNNPGFLASASDAWIRHTIVNGRPGTRMPRQAKLGLTDSDVDHVVAYIRGFDQHAQQAEEIEVTEATLVIDSPYDFLTTINNLKQSLQGLNFRYFPDRYLEMGLAADSVINKKQLSLRFCNFKQLYKIINIEPRLGVVLPCRVTVVEEDDGSVKIYTMNMQMVSRLFNNSQLEETAREMHQGLMEVIDEATL